MSMRRVDNTERKGSVLYRPSCNLNCLQINAPTTQPKKKSDAKSMSKKRGKYLRIQQIDDFSYLLKRIDRSAIGVLTRRAQDLSTAIPTRTCHSRRHYSIHSPQRWSPQLPSFNRPSCTVIRSPFPPPQNQSTNNLHPSLFAGMPGSCGGHSTLPGLYVFNRKSKRQPNSSTRSLITSTPYPIANKYR